MLVLFGGAQSGMDSFLCPSSDSSLMDDLNYLHASLVEEISFHILGKLVLEFIVRKGVSVSKLWLQNHVSFGIYSFTK